ncbi:MAG: hypothetical protein ABSA11_16775 [Candidatus Bathyarchaeia archaeon]
MPQGNVHGRVIYRIPYLGWLMLNPTITLGLAISIFIVLLVWPGRTKSIKASRIRHRRRSDYQQLGATADSVDHDYGVGYIVHTFTRTMLLRGSRTSTGARSSGADSTSSATRSVRRPPPRVD